MSSNDAVVVFTAKLTEEVQHLGSGNWVLDPGRARKCEFLVCTRNGRTPDWGVPTPEAHGSAFLVGRVEDVVPSKEAAGRWVIKISEYAVVDVPNAWCGVRNPVHYTSLAALGINPAELNFKSVPKPKSSLIHTAQPPHSKLTIADAKAQLAESLGVSPESIEIIIRG
jgi:hypothetical protein